MKEDEIVHKIEECFIKSYEKFATNQNISQSTLLRIVTNQFLHPYRMQRVQAILLGVLKH